MTSEKAERFFKFHDYLKPLLEKAEKLRDSPLPSSYDKTALYPIDKEVIEASLLFLSRDDRIKLCAYFDPLLDICKELFPEDIHLFSVPEELLSFPEEEYPAVSRRPISPRRRTPRYYKPREQIRYPERPLSPPRESSRRPSYRYEEERVSRPTTLRETLRPSYRYEEERLPPPPSYPPPPPPVEPSEGERISRPTTLRGTPQRTSRLPRIPMSAVYPRK